MSLSVRYYRNAYKRVVHCELEFADGTLFSCVPGAGARFLSSLENEKQLWNSAVDWNLGCISLPLPGLTDGVVEDVHAMARGLVGGRFSRFAWFMATWTPFPWPFAAGWYDADVTAFLLKVAGLPLRQNPWCYSAASLYREHLRVINE